MRGADYRRAHEKAVRQAAELIRTDAKTPAACAAAWERFDLRTYSTDGILPRLPRGLTEVEIGRAIRALCDLVIATKADTSARRYGVLGVFHLLAESSGEGS